MVSQAKAEFKPKTVGTEKTLPVHRTYGTHLLLDVALSLPSIYLAEYLKQTRSDLVVGWASGLRGEVAVEQV